MRKVIELIDKNAVYEEMMTVMAGTGYQSRALSVIEAMPVINPPPNDPLTLEELREMGSDMYSLMYSPVWIECKKSQMYNWTGYDLIAVHNELIISALDRLLSIRDYGDSWLAYRRRPEGEKCDEGEGCQ
ncbi:MAG: hypothetical protein K2O18_07225 [Oscillospiraceae bacterium]|nr:hypothetical protein [Oscillospiraceae bacterium]